MPRARSILAALATAAFLLTASGAAAAPQLIVNTTPEQRPIALYSDDDVVATSLPVDLPTDTYRTLLRVVVPVQPGDVLDVDARARVTNNNSYNIGIGYHLWAYNVDCCGGSAGPWWRISTLNGDNVDRQRHHMPLHTSTVYRVPDDWTPGDRIVVVYRGDAHSTAWRPGDTVVVDQEYALLVARRWTTPTP